MCDHLVDPFLILYMGKRGHTYRGIDTEALSTAPCLGLTVPSCHPGAKGLTRAESLPLQYPGTQFFPLIVLFLNLEGEVGQKTQTVVEECYKEENEGVGSEIGRGFGDL